MVRRVKATRSAVGMAPHAGPSPPTKPPFPPSYPLEFRFSLATLPPGKIKFPISRLKSGDHLFLAVMPMAGTPDDPHAGYEGRKGGMIYVASAKNGSKVFELKLETPVVWDGMAAADSKLFVSTADGTIRCFSAP